MTEEDVAKVMNHDAVLSVSSNRGGFTTLIKEAVMVEYEDADGEQKAFVVESDKPGVHITAPFVLRQLRNKLDGTKRVNAEQDAEPGHSGIVV